MKDFDTESRNLTPFNPSTGKNYSKKQVMRKPFILDKFSLPDEVFSMLESDSFVPLFMNTTQEYFKKYDVIMDHKDEQYVVWNLLSNLKLIIEFMDVYMKSNNIKAMARKETDAFSALIVRLQKFRVKYCAINQTFITAPNSNSAVREKISAITNSLRTKKIILKINDDSKLGPITTFLSTINAIASFLKITEMALKDLIPTILSSCYKYNEVYAMGNEDLAKALNNIAPPTFVGLEGDYYYIISLFRANGHTAFDPIQRKQWDSYYNEINKIFNLFIVNGPIKEDCFDFLINKRNTINIPYNKFVELTKISNNTFSRIINAMNTIMPIIWCVILNNFSPENIEE